MAGGLSSARWNCTVVNSKTYYLELFYYHYRDSNCVLNLLPYFVVTLCKFTLLTMLYNSILMFMSWCNEIKIYNYCKCTLLFFILFTCLTRYTKDQTWIRMQVKRKSSEGKYFLIAWKSIVGNERPAKIMVDG